jgi:hypothetical protein
MEGKEGSLLKEIIGTVILGEAEFSGKIKGLLKGEEIGQDVVWEK